MTTQIFFENQSLTRFELRDLDNRLFGQINERGTYSFRLNFSTSFNKEYRLISANSQLSFTLNINGEIANVTNNNLFILQIGNETRCGKGNNKLTIIPITTPPVPPLRLIEEVPLPVLLYNDY